MNSLTKTYHIEISNVDANFNVTPKYIMEMLQDIATDHANILGFGWNDLRKESKVWVLSKIKVESSIEKDTSVINLTTWPLQPNRFFAGRDFIGTDGNGNVVLRATSIWSLLDIQSRKMLNPHDIDHLYGGPYLEKNAGVEAKWEKLTADESYGCRYVKNVRWTDLDINRHVNNTNYTQWAMDCIDSPDFNGKIRQMEVTFHSECLMGDEIKIMCNNGKSLRCVGIKDGKTCFTAKFDFAFPEN